jgi:hypothetical protein
MRPSRAALCLRGFARTSDLPDGKMAVCRGVAGRGPCERLSTGDDIDPKCGGPVMVPTELARILCCTLFASPPGGSSLVLRVRVDSLRRGLSLAFIPALLCRPFPILPLRLAVLVISSTRGFDIFAGHVASRIALKLSASCLIAVDSGALPAVLEFNGSRTSGVASWGGFAAWLGLPIAGVVPTGTILTVLILRALTARRS